jgi:hypothetical protein
MLKPNMKAQEGEHHLTKWRRAKLAAEADRLFTQGAK